MKSKKSETWYVVFVGASPGIYSRYDEVKRYTQGISKSYFKKYDTKKRRLRPSKKVAAATTMRRSIVNGDLSHQLGHE